MLPEQRVLFGQKPFVSDENQFSARQI